MSGKEKSTVTHICAENDAYCSLSPLCPGTSSEQLLLMDS